MRVRLNSLLATIKNAPEPSTARQVLTLPLKQHSRDSWLSYNSDLNMNKSSYTCINLHSIKVCSEIDRITDCWYEWEIEIL